jgi:RNA polymerase sigma factor (sigma-70 family)
MSGGHDRIVIQEQLLADAHAAARAGRIDEMISLLYDSHYLDGLTRGMQSKWSELRGEDLEDAVAEAVQELVKECRSGRSRIEQLRSWLWRVADRKAGAMFRDRVREASAAPEALMPSQVTADRESEDESSGSDEEDPDQKRLAAVRTARRLLPRLELESERLVLSVLIDAVEDGVEELSVRRIAEITGLAKSTADEAVKRALRKLRRLAREEGESARQFEAVTSGLDDDDERSE